MIYFSFHWVFKCDDVQGSHFVPLPHTKCSPTTARHPENQSNNKNQPEECEMIWSFLLVPASHMDIKRHITITMIVTMWAEQSRLTLFFCAGTDNWEEGRRGLMFLVSSSGHRTTPL